MTIQNPKSEIQNLLTRPLDQRRREYKYRFAQGVVFGLPVLALQRWGTSLGPADAGRWVPILQALLAGWVLYVNLGMFVEGLLLSRRGKLTADLLISALAAAMYGFSLVSALHIVVSGWPWYRPMMFHATVLLLIAWGGIRWAQMSLQKKI